MKNIDRCLSDEEIVSINKKYTKIYILIDKIMILRNDNIQKLQPFIKKIYKKSKKKQFYMNKDKDISINSDPYKFKEIPSTIKNTILNLMKNNNIGLTTLAYKCNIHSHIIYNYLYYNHFIDNYILHKILSFFNYDLETGKFIDNKYDFTNKSINFENTAFKNIDIEPIDLKTLNIDKL